jgi:DNA-binding winged helix-turn-helix (wHTH) protein
VVPLRDPWGAEPARLQTGRVGLRFGPFRIDPEQRELRCGRVDVAVQPLVFDLFVYFLRRPNVLVTRDDLIRDVWKGAIVSDGSITQAISLLRRLLRNADGPGHPLRTVWGRGYRLIVSTREDDGARPTIPDPRE